MKTKVLVGRLTAFLFIVAMCIGFVSSTNAKAATSYLVSARPSGGHDCVLEPGKYTHVTVPVKPSGGAFYSIYVYALSGSSASKDITISNVKLKSSGYENTFDVTSIVNDSNISYLLDFDVYCSEMAKIGYNNISIMAEGILSDSDDNPDIRNDIELITLTAYTAYERTPAEIVVDKCKYNESAVLPEGSFNMNLTLKNAGELQALNAYLTMEFDDSGIIPNYSIENIKIGSLKAGEQKDVSLALKVLKNAVPGVHTIRARITAKDSEGKDIGPFVSTMYITIKEKEPEKVVDTGAPIITLSTPDNYKDFTPDSSDEIKVKVANVGQKDATSVKVAVKSGLGAAIGLTKEYTSDYIEVGTLKVGEEKNVNIPITVAKEFSSGLYEIEIEAIYKDTDKKDQSPVNMTMYVKGPETEKPDVAIKNAVGISNVSQSPSSPKAGSTVTVSFTITNEGNAPVDNVRVYGMGLSPAGFEPITSEPDQKVGTIPANGSAKVSMNFKVGKDIPAGFNGLNIGYSYQDANKQSFNGECTVYILNVINNKETAPETVISKPKLIISNSYTDVDNLRAGNEFDFTFDLKNTHSTKSAKNIKVIISQEDGVFAPVKGSNILYIDEITAKEISSNTIHLKARGDVITGDYGLKIRVEYEYDDMSESDQEKGGVSDETEIKIHVLENYRPVIENVTVDAWNGITVGNPVDLSFEFYNMGKSTLGNVYVTVEGDFALANNSAMSYVGAVNGYSQEYVNPQIVALVGGEAIGTLVVHFEDSNGDEVTLSQEFTAYVTEEDYGGDYGNWGEEYDPGMWDDGGMGYEEGDLGEGTEEFSFLGLTLIPFICVCAGIVLVIIVIIVIVVKKKKAARDEDDDE